MRNCKPENVVDGARSRPAANMAQSVPRRKRSFSHRHSDPADLREAIQLVATITGPRPPVHHRPLRLPQGSPRLFGSTPVSTFRCCPARAPRGRRQQAVDLLEATRNYYPVTVLVKGCRNPRRYSPRGAPLLAVFRRTDPHREDEFEAERLADRSRISTCCDWRTAARRRFQQLETAVAGCSLLLLELNQFSPGSCCNHVPAAPLPHEPNISWNRKT